jgi:hypothetical protein
MPLWQQVSQKMFSFIKLQKAQLVGVIEMPSFGVCHIIFSQ